MDVVLIAGMWLDATDPRRGPTRKPHLPPDTASTSRRLDVWVLVNTPLR